MTDTTFGGFSHLDIKNAIIEDCLASGDPENYFRVLTDCLVEIDNAWNEDSDYWKTMSEA